MLMSLNETVLISTVPYYFPHIFGPNEDQGLDYDAAYIKFEELRNSCPEGQKFSVPELAQGFIKVANEAMCRPIRNLTTMKGHDLSLHTLAVFGGGMYLPTTIYIYITFCNLTCFCNNLVLYEQPVHSMHVLLRRI